MRRQSSSSAPKPFICTLRLTSAVLIWVHQDPLLKARRNAHLNALGAEYFAPLRINWVKRNSLHTRDGEASVERTEAMDVCRQILAYFR